MSKLCDYKCCNNNPVLEKLTKDNFEKVIWGIGRFVLHRKHLTIYRVVYTGKLKTEDGSWVKCVSYNTINDYSTHYTRTINSFIENFVSIILADFEERLLDEKLHLEEKLKRLENFIDENPKFEELDEQDKELMQQQYTAMRVYYDLLYKRVTKMLNAKIEEYDALPSTGK